LRATSPIGPIRRERDVSLGLPAVLFALKLALEAVHSRTPAQAAVHIPAPHV